MLQRETHVAVVVDTNDPEQKLRIKVKCAGLLGGEGAAITEWIPPKLTWGFVVLPDIDEQVEIEVTTGSDTDEVKGQSFLDSPDMRWTGVRFQGPNAYNDMFSSANYGKRRGFVTPAGHVLMFDDTAGSEKINLVWHNQDDSYAMFSMDEDGSIIIANKNGSMVYLNAKDGELAVIDENGNSMSMDSNGIKLIDSASNIIEMKGGGSPVIQILGQGSVTVSCANAVLDSGKVEIGGSPAVEALLKGTSFNSALITWTAALLTCLGTASPPISGLSVFATANTTFLAQVLAALSLKGYTQ